MWASAHVTGSRTSRVLRYIVQGTPLLREALFDPRNRHNLDPFHATRAQAHYSEQNGVWVTTSTSPCSSVPGKIAFENSGEKKKKTHFFFPDSLERSFVFLFCLFHVVRLRAATGRAAATHARVVRDV